MTTPSPQLQGFLLLVSVLMVGVFVSVLGPSLPDLKCLYNVELDMLSYLLLAFGLGGVSGQIVAPYFLRRVPVYLLLASLMALSCVFYFALTYAGVYVALILVFIASLASGCALNVVLYKTNILWPGNPRTVYLVFGFIALGSVVSPLVLQPFLSDGSVTRSYRITSDIDLTLPVMMPQTLHNETPYVVYDSELESVNNSSRSTKTRNASVILNDNCREFLTLIQYPLMIFGLFGLSTIGMFLYIFSKEPKHPQGRAYEIMREDKPPYTKSQCVFIVMMFLFFLQGQGFPTGYSALLTTFGTEGHLGISLSKLAWMTSLFWFAFLIARLLPCVFPAQANQLHILLGSALCLFVSVVILCFSLNNEVLLWLATILTGFSTAPIVPAGMAWVRTIIPLTPVLRSIFLTGVAFGFVFPYVCGTMISLFGTDAFVYSFLGFNISSLVVFVLAIISAKVSGNM